MKHSETAYLQIYFKFKLLIYFSFVVFSDDLSVDENYKRRSQLFDQLTEFFPEHMTQPKENLIDLIVLWSFAASLKNFQRRHFYLLVNLLYDIRIEEMCLLFLVLLNFFDQDLLILPRWPSTSPLPFII